MKKYILLLVLITLSNVFGQTNQQLPNGTGTNVDPYQISSLSNLSWLCQHSAEWDKYFIQTDNLDASETINWDDTDDNGDGDKFNDTNDITLTGNNEGFSPIGLYSSLPFTGFYDGLGFTIDGISITNRQTRGNGFFGYIQSGIAIIKNIGLTNIDIRGENRVAGLVAVCGNNTIENCYVKGIITGVSYGGSLYQIGGLVAYGGWSGSTQITDCYNEANIIVTGNHSYVGGLAGRMLNSSSITRCYNSGNISGGNGVGGLIGFNISCNVSESYTTGSVTSLGNNIGGFAGINRSESKIINCYSYGDVTRSSGGNNVYGSFCGDNRGEIENCYSTGAVNFDNNNGFVAFQVGGTYTSNYFDSQTTLQTSGIGATAKTTLEMQTESTFLGWDFLNIWEKFDGNYPELNIDVGEIETISNGSLSISVGKLSHGIKVSSIQNAGIEVLNLSTVPNLFDLEISGSNIGALGGWNSVNIINSGTELSIQFSNPINTNLFPSGLGITVTISVENEKSEWDISVTGLNNKSLYYVTFPTINIKANGNDTFLRPKFSGQEIDNPVSSELNTDLLYPRGSGATMQFSAYYNNSYGVYFGMHDPLASIKNIKTIAKDGGLEYSNIFPIPNRSVNGNDWEMSGVFALHSFIGNWYEAAQIYEQWASLEANYWPQPSVARTVRQNKFGSIGAWAYMRTKDTAVVRTEIEGFHNVVGVPVGILWYDWSQNIDGIDENYPKFLPEIDGMTEIVNRLQANGDVFITPYTNGRLYDVSLGDYNTNGKPYATKDDNVDVYHQHFTGNTFAVMCPTESAWQNTLIDIQDNLTNRIGVKGSYLDQVCHADPKECMDPTHSHPVGGGSFWQQGYSTIVSSMHNLIPLENFITSEGAAEFLHNELDGCYTLGWKADKLVPAYPAIYAGKIQNFGISIGTSEYDAPSFYSKLATIFNFGIQMGGTTTSIQGDSRAIAVPARAFLRKLAKLRYKLREFMSFGKMLKPLIDVSGMSTITSDWEPKAAITEVTVSALQQSFWENSFGKKEVIVFTNASKTQTLNFTLNYVGSDHGLSGNLKVQRVMSESDDPIINEGNSFSRNISLAPLEAEAYIINSEGYVLLETKIFLEGAYNSTNGLMSTSLNEVLPLISPYQEDVRTVNSIPNNIVDWILVELRETLNGNAIASQSAFLRNDGRIVSDSGEEQITLSAPVNNYFIVIKHRNHLAVMSENLIPLNSTNTTLFDFTIGEN